MLRLRSCRHHVVDSLTRDSFDCDRDRVGSSVRCPQRLQRERSPLPPRRRRAQRRHYSQQQLPQGCSGRRPQVQLAQARCRRRSCKRSMEPPMMTSCGSAPSSVSSSSRRIGAAAEPPQPLRLRLRRLLRRLHLLLRVSPTTTSSLTARAFQTSTTATTATASSPRSTTTARRMATPPTGRNDHRQFCARDRESTNDFGTFSGWYCVTCGPNGDANHAFCNPSTGRRCYAMHCAGVPRVHGLRLGIKKNRPVRSSPPRLRRRRQRRQRRPWRPRGPRARGQAEPLMMSWAGGVARVYEGSQETVCRQQGARARPTCARECRRSNYEVTVFGLSPGRV